MLSTSPKCEPQLGRRGLYAATGGEARAYTRNMAMLWVPNLSDGSHSLLELAERSGIRFLEIDEAALRLQQHGLFVVPAPHLMAPTTALSAPARPAV